MDLTSDQHRQLGIDLFNRTWELMDVEDRSPDDDDTLLATAYASLYHWKQVGTPENSSRGEWQVSRVYTVLGRAEPALHHAGRCLAICQAHGIGDWDLAYAYEALARASVTAGDLAAARGYLAEARQAADRIADPEDRDHFEEDLATIEV
jgi:hypothetical protein